MCDSKSDKRYHLFLLFLGSGVARKTHGLNISYSIHWYGSGKLREEVEAWCGWSCMKLTVEGSLGYSQKAIEIVQVVVGLLANHSTLEVSWFKRSILKHRSNNQINLHGFKFILSWMIRNHQIFNRHFIRHTCLGGAQCRCTVSVDTIWGCLYYNHTPVLYQYQFPTRILDIYGWWTLNNCVLKNPQHCCTLCNTRTMTSKITLPCKYHCWTENGPPLNNSRVAIFPFTDGWDSGLT